MDEVSFDLDGTLIHTFESRSTSLECALDAVDPELASLSAKVYCDAFREALAKRLPGVAREMPVRRAAFRQTFEAAGCVPEEAVLEAVVLAYRRRRLERMVPRSGAADLLSRVRRDRPVVVVTNGPAGLQREKLRLTGLKSHVDAMAVAGRCGLRKPDPRLFDFAFERAGISSWGGYHLGDSNHDVEGARRAGLTPVVLVTDDTLPHGIDKSAVTCGSLKSFGDRFLDLD
jgi:FMN phosphatase YigB (HAD superfamily)